jgi:hypothetical protein
MLLAALLPVSPTCGEEAVIAPAVGQRNAVEMEGCVAPSGVVDAVAGAGDSKVNFGGSCGSKADVVCGGC